MKLHEIFNETCEQKHEPSRFHRNWTWVIHATADKKHSRRELRIRETKKSRKGTRVNGKVPKVRCIKIINGQIILTSTFLHVQKGSRNELIDIA